MRHPSFVLLGGGVYTRSAQSLLWLCTQESPWWTWNYIGCQGSITTQPHARQISYLLYYHSGPETAFIYSFISSSPLRDLTSGAQQPSGHSQPCLGVTVWAWQVFIWAGCMRGVPGLPLCCAWPGRHERTEIEFRTLNLRACALSFEPFPWPET